jgi:hypothetical protein
MGKKDIIKHSGTKSHLENAKVLRAQSTLQLPSTTDIDKTTEVELKFAILTASCNIPLAFHDQLSPMIRPEFCDSKIGARYHSASTKAMCMLNLAVTPFLKEKLISEMRVHPFSLSVDGSNDTGLEKMNPLTVRIYNYENKTIATRFLDMCSSHTATAEGIFGVIDRKLSELIAVPNPWDHCTSFGVDNTSTNIGVRNSIKTKVLSKNSAVFFSGCPCHILHNAAQKAAIAFTLESKFELEEFIVDLYYWFDGSTKRKNGLKSIVHSVIKSTKVL